jgi:pimeloyl-ACP methyl ester carboxylesterase
MDRLAPTFRVIAVDLYGYGQSPAWSGRRPFSMDDEVTLLEPVFRSAGERFHLVGHSYGGAIALKTALAHTGRVASLAIFEPVLFSILLAEDPEQPAAREIISLGDDTSAAVDSGEPARAAQRFIDYWMGEGAWETTPEKRREPIASSMRKVKDEWRAIFADSTPLAKLSELLVPTLLMTGAESPASSRGVARILASVLPGVTTIEVASVGHMAPITHPDKINALIEEHLERYA